MGPPLKRLLRGVLLTGTEPTRLGITLDMGSEVSASHRLMEVSRTTSRSTSQREERTAVYSPVISALILTREAESDTNTLWTKTSAKTAAIKTDLLVVCEFEN